MRADRGTLRRGWQAPRPVTHLLSLTHSARRSSLELWQALQPGGAQPCTPAGRANRITGPLDRTQRIATVAS